MYKRNMPQMVEATSNIGKAVNVGAKATALAAGIIFTAVFAVTFAVMVMTPKLDQVSLSTLSEQAAMAQFSEEASKYNH